jgi:hypothetical protein
MPNPKVRKMEKADNYLLLLIGVLLVALIAVELIPLPQMSALPITAAPATHKGVKFGSASEVSVLIIPTSTLATVNVVG